MEYVKDGAKYRVGSISGGPSRWWAKPFREPATHSFLYYIIPTRIIQTCIQHRRSPVPRNNGGFKVLRFVVLALVSCDKKLNWLLFCLLWIAQKVNAGVSKVLQTKMWNVLLKWPIPMMIDHFLSKRVDFIHKKLVSSFLTVQKIKYSHRIQNLFYSVEVFMAC